MCHDLLIYSKHSITYQILSHLLLEQVVNFFLYNLFNFAKFWNFVIMLILLISSEFGLIVFGMNSIELLFKQVKLMVCKFF